MVAVSPLQRGREVHVAGRLGAQVAHRLHPALIDRHVEKARTAEGIRLGDAEGQESHHPTRQREPGQA